MPVWHYQPFTFYLAFEAVLPDHRIILAPHFCFMPTTPLPTLCIGTGYGNGVCLIIWTDLYSPVAGRSETTLPLQKGWCVY